MSALEIPSPENTFLAPHAKLLSQSYQRLTGKELFGGRIDEENIPQALFQASFGLVSHNTDPVPVFNYGNETALAVFEMSWDDFTQLASRDSAEATSQAEREILMAKVTKDGFIDGYRGLRISASGRRFWIEKTTIWNVIDDSGIYQGQAAKFYLEE